MLIKKEGNKSKRNLKRQLWVLLLVYDQNINQKLLSSPMAWENKEDLWSHWIEKQKTKEKNLFIAILSHIPIFGVFHVSHYRSSMVFDVCSMCVYTFGVLSLGWRHTNCEITHIIFWHFRCLLSRKDNKDKWQQNTKSPRQNSIYTNDISLMERKEKRKKKYENVQRSMEIYFLLSIA